MPESEFIPRPGDPVINREIDNELQAPPMGTDDSASQTLAAPSHEQATPGEETPAAAEATPAETTTETPADTTTGDQTPEQQAAATQQAESEKEFKTDYKYKVRDEEHEIEEWARPFIKDQETFKKFQDLHTRGHGLEIAKKERDDYKTKFETMEQGINIASSFVQEYYQNPNNAEVGAAAARKFIDSLQLPKQMFLQYALSELKYQQLPPEQKQVVDAQRHQEQQLMQYQTQAQTLQQTNQQLAVQQHEMALNAAMGDPNTAGIANEYDTKVGTLGAFRKLVVERGIYHEQVSGQTKPVNEVVNEVVQMLGITPQGTGTQTGLVGTQQAQNPNPQQMQQAQQPAQQQVTRQQQHPVLPNISGQGTASPVKRTFTSIDDIRNRYNELTNAQA